VGDDLVDTLKHAYQEQVDRGGARTPAAACCAALLATAAGALLEPAEAAPLQEDELLQQCVDDLGCTKWAEISAMMKGKSSKQASTQSRVHL
jgi:hypothetical protein